MTQTYYCKYHSDKGVFFMKLKGIGAAEGIAVARLWHMEKIGRASCRERV